MTPRTIRLLVVILTLSVLVTPPAAEAQLPGKVYRIGYIAPGAGPSVLTETLSSRVA
jgi:hypothetical protein